VAERLRNEFGKIDIVVNDIWGAELLKGGPSEWNTPVWELDLEKGSAYPASRNRRSHHHFTVPSAIINFRNLVAWSSKLLMARRGTTLRITEFRFITI
jgi:hypothetical protein